MEPISIILMLLVIFAKSGGFRDITKFFSPEVRKEAKQVRQDFSKFSPIVSKIKKNGDGYEIIQNSIGF